MDPSEASQNFNLDLMSDGLEEMNDTKKKEIIDDLLKSVPYNLSVALIKISQLNNYEPLQLDTYYNNILPAFELLRRTDGSKYRTNSKTVVRSAMVSNRLYNRTAEGLYEINLTNAIKHLQMIKQKKAINESEYDKTEMSIPVSSQMSQIYEKPDDLGTSVYDDDLMNKTDKSIRKPRKDKLDRPELEFIGRRRRRKKFKRGGMRMDVERYVRTYELLQKLMRIAERDKALYSQINFDFSEIGDPNNINEKKINIDKIIGMLTVFKFYRTFLEKFFNAVRIQDTLREKIAELNSEANYIEAIFRSSE
jgi:hypothetical protein